MNAKLRWLLVVIALAILWVIPHELVRGRAALAASLIVLGAAVLAARTVGAAIVRGSYRTTWVMAGLCLVTLVAVVMTNTVHEDASTIAFRAAMMAASWTIALAAPEWPLHIQPPRRPVAIALIGLAAVLVLGTIQTLHVGRYAVTFDELVYILQGRWLRAPGFGFHVAAADHPLFRLDFTYWSGDRLLTHYTPGWPALLGLFDALSLVPLAAPFCGALAVVGAGMLAARLARDAGEQPAGWAALAAAAWLLTQQRMLETSTGYQSHPMNVAAIVWAAWALLEPRPARWWFAGLLLGVSVAIRPLTGATVGAGLVLWAMIRADRVRVGMLVALVGGGMLPVAALLAYNALTTGSPLLFGYTRLHGSYHSLGFGPRGWPPHYIFLFTPAMAAYHVGQRAWNFTRLTLGVGLLLPLIAVLRAAGASWRWRMVAPFFLLPLVYTFYFGSADRFYIELLPLLVAGLASQVVRVIGPESRRLATIWVLGCLTNVLFAPDWSRGEFWRPPPATVHSIQALARQADRNPLLLVIDSIIDPAKSRDHLVPLFMLTGRDTTARVLVVRDLGATTDSYVQRHPARTALHVSWCGDEAPLDVRPYALGAPPACPP